MFWIWSLTVGGAAAATGWLALGPWLGQAPRWLEHGFAYLPIPTLFAWSVVHIAAALFAVAFLQSLKDLRQKKDR